ILDRDRGANRTCRAHLTWFGSREGHGAGSQKWRCGAIDQVSDWTRFCRSIWHELGVPDNLRLPYFYSGRSETTMLDRKDFLSGIAGVTVTLIVNACGGGDDSNGGSAGNGDGDCKDVDVAITSNHGHVLNIALADIEAAQTKTYSIKGTSN